MAIEIWKEIVSASAIFASVVLGIRTLKKSERINLRNKRVDVVMHCNARYDQIYDAKTRLQKMGHSPELEALVQSYYARYWGLKSDEFDYWLADLIDLETYCNWSFMTMQAFQENEPACLAMAERDFLNGWKTVGRNDNLVTNAWFYELTEATREVAKLWDQIVKRNEELKNSQPLRRKMYMEMIEILQIVFVQSKEYRDTLLDGVGFETFKKTLENHPVLGLSILDRKSNITEDLAELELSLVEGLNRRKMLAPPPLSE